jgi:P-type conjugative transfer protein TrbJ
MKTKILLLVSLLGLITGLTIHSYNNPANAADAVYCTNCGSEWTAIASKLIQAEQLAKQGQQLATEISQYRLMLTNSQTVASHLFGPAMQDFQKLQSIMAQSKALAASAKNIDQVFAQKYKTYEEYLKSTLSGQSLQNKYAQWSQSANDNTLYTMKALGMKTDQLQNSQAIMQQLQAKASSAQGQMQAIQTANMIAAQNVAELQSLQQTLMLNTQMMANYIQQQNDKEALQRANSIKYYAPHIETRQNIGW